jgi:hypothetical protein
MNRTKLKSVDLGELYAFFLTEFEKNRRSSFNLLLLAAWVM